MDRTKLQAKAARDQHKNRTNTLHSAEKEVLDLEEVLLQTRERVKATKAARSRAADLRRKLKEHEEEEQSVWLPMTKQSPPFPMLRIQALLSPLRGMLLRLFILLFILSWLSAAFECLEWT